MNKLHKDGIPDWFGYRLAKFMNPNELPDNSYIDDNGIVMVWETTAGNIEVFADFNTREAVVKHPWGDPMIGSLAKNKYWKELSGFIHSLFILTEEANKNG